jgi:hypothetical protein
MHSGWSFANDPEQPEVVNAALVPKSWSVIEVSDMKSIASPLPGTEIDWQWSWCIRLVMNLFSSWDLGFLDVLIVARTKHLLDLYCYRCDCLSLVDRDLWSCKYCLMRWTPFFLLGMHIFPIVWNSECICRKLCVLCWSYGVFTVFGAALENCSSEFLCLLLICRTLFFPPRTRKSNVCLLHYDRKSYSFTRIGKHTVV